MHYHPLHAAHGERVGCGIESRNSEVFMNESEYKYVCAKCGWVQDTEAVWKLCPNCENDTWKLIIEPKETTVSGEEGGTG